MAAPCGVGRVLLLRHALSRLQIQPCVVAYQLQQVRFKKRLKAPPTAAKEQETWRPKIRKTISKEEVEPEEVLGKVPEDDIWIRKYYPTPVYSVEKAVEMHQELAAPALLNNTDGLLHLKCKLDMRTKKKTKFMHSISKTVVLPHLFQDGLTNRVLALCKTVEDKERALEQGASFAGGNDIIKQIQKGEIIRDDFDHVVCTPDMIVEITAIRKYLTDLFPHKSKGNLGADIGSLVHHFSVGRTYESYKEEDQVGYVEVKIGRLDMTTEELVANFSCYIEAICSQKSPVLGPFIMKAHLTCPPSPEKFLLQNEVVLPLDQRDKPQKTLEQEEEEPAKKDLDDDDDDEPVRVSSK